MWLLAAGPAAAEGPPEWTREYCSLVRACGLPAPAAGAACTPQLSAGVGGVDYDHERCAEARELAARGVLPGAPERVAVFRFLGRRYRVAYDLEGTVRLSPGRLSLLLEDLPLAARLLSHLRGVAYHAEYLDDTRRRFRARRSDDLQASAEQLTGSPAERLVVYYGSGTSKLGPWRLRGQGLVRMTWTEAPGGLRYRIRVVAAPANAMINAFMRLGLFRRALHGRIGDVMQDITTASADLDRQGMDAVAWTSWPAEEKRKVAKILATP